MTLNLFLDKEKIEELITLLNLNITNLSQEIIGYDLMQKYLNIYLNKLQSYYLILQKAILETPKNLDTMLENDSFDFAESLNRHLAKLN